ncbi:MAG: hypothetical protein Ct9H300mP19_02290 [Dehalococcoidia bacterium]|nr:MAG: hypothetical protein Ct9H300mP19_02290 [Dehalococcoidia bacterium]
MGPDGTLVFITDESGWWNLAKLENGVSSTILSEKSDHGGPAWQFGFSTYAFLPGDDVRILLKDSNNGEGRLREIGLMARFCLRLWFLILRLQM